LARITTAQVRDWNARLRGPDGPGASTAAKCYRLLRSILTTAVEDGLIPANPCTIKGAGSVKADERITATPDEVLRLAGHMPPRLRAAVIVAAWSGLRAGELFALTRAHVDLARGSLRVDQALVELPGQPPMFGPPKTKTSRRTVHLPGPVVELLAEHIANHVRPGANALVFSTEDGRPITQSTRQRHWRRARAAEGLDTLRWHDLRHTGATEFARAGATMKELQARLGHSTVEAALVYQHATAERDRAIAERMGSVIAAPLTSGPTLLRSIDTTHDAPRAGQEAHG
jgi:integrase